MSKAELSPLPRRPLLIWIGIVSAWFWSVLLTWILLVDLVTRVIPGGMQGFPSDGEAVSAGEFYTTVGPILVVQVFLSVGLALGLQRRHLWPRNVIVLFWGTLAGALLSHSLLFGSLVAPWLAFCVWYFFYKPNVLAYFGLRAEEPELRRRPLVLALLLILSSLWFLRGIATIPYELADLFAGVGEPLTTLTGAVAVLAAGLCAAGLWRFKPWASLAFAAWGLATLVRGFALSSPGAGQDTWVLAAFVGLLALVVLLISAYLNVSLARPEPKAPLPPAPNPVLQS